MRITEKMVEERVARLNKDKKIIKFCQRNNYHAIDNAKGNECYECGLSTKEAYLVVKGIEVGLQIAITEMKEIVENEMGTD